MMNINNIKNKIITYVNKKENYGMILLGILVLIFLVFTAIYILGTGNISKIEENKIVKQSQKYMEFIEDITESKSKGLDKYIIFTLDYNLYNNHKNEMTTKEIKQYINETFNKKIKNDDIISVGITKEMLNKNITYDSGSDIYKINVDNETGKQIEERKIVYTKLTKIRRKNKNTYTVKYNKYVIDNPYNILNYYIDLNRNQNKAVDITPIKNYLLGSSSSKEVKKLIEKNEKDLEKYSKKNGKIKITYIMKGDKLIIQKIK
ncbi:MAG: hypothetical protein J5970_04780 [Bacilli bacterium]|nr:hypothetical protein [Bacilli bacterium]